MSLRNKPRSKLSKIARTCLLAGVLGAMVPIGKLLSSSFLKTALADSTMQSIPLTQNWTNTGLITANDNWSGVPGIEGFLGQDITTSTGTDPQTLVGTSAVANDLDVIANQTNPNTLATGGVAEFDGIVNPTIALQGSGTADAPHIILNLNTTGLSSINVSYNVRDIDGSTDNAVQPVALQFRVGSSGNFTNVPTGFIADATTGPNLATLVTPVNVTLPAAAGNQSLVQVRIITSNAAGNDEWVGIDDISITGAAGSTNPSGVGLANPSSLPTGASTLLTVTVTPGTNPASTGLAVTGDLSSIGGSATQEFFDNGTNGDVTPGDNIFSLQLTVSNSTTPGPKAIPVSIADAASRSGSTLISLTVQSAPIAVHDIQGSGTASPYAGQTVTTTPSIVTALRGNGFFIQTPDASVDGDPNTSEGTFVFTSSAPPAKAAIGNSVTVTGTVQEFIPSSDLNSPGATEIAGSPTVTLLANGNSLPAAISLSASDTAVNNLNNLEKFEGMRVHVASLTVVAPTAGNLNESNATSVSNGLFYGVIGGVTRPFRERGIQTPDPTPSPAPNPNNIPTFDANPERIRVDSNAQPGATTLNVTAGATVNNITGPLDYGLRTYTILPDAATPPTVLGIISAVPVPTPAANEFTIASFNMERFYDTVDDPSTADVVLTVNAFSNRLSKASLAIRNVMRMPDIIGVEEMENLTTLQAVANQVNNDAVAAGSPNPAYQAYLVEGNDVGGIDVGFLIKSTRVNIVDVTQFGKTDTYINPNNHQPEILNDRPPLVLRAVVAISGETPCGFTVIVNHLRSLRGIDDPTDGNRVRTKRRAQAEYLANLLQARQLADPGERIISIGDYNAFQVNDGYVDSIGTIKGTPTPADQVLLASNDLVDPDLADLIDYAPADQAYSYSFDGNAQAIDHELLNPRAFAMFSRIAFARNNVDFPETYRNDPTRPERISDHDMAVAYFIPPAPSVSPAKISGEMTKSDTSPVPGVTVTLSGSTARLAITDSLGHYEFSNLLPGGVYIVIPSRANYAFLPASRSFSLAVNRTDAIFSAVPDAVETANPLDTSEYFVRQQYLDFLGREPMRVVSAIGALRSASVVLILPA